MHLSKSSHWREGLAPQYQLFCILAFLLQFCVLMFLPCSAFSRVSLEIWANSHQYIIALTGQGRGSESDIMFPNRKDSPLSDTSNNMKLDFYMVFCVLVCLFEGTKYIVSMFWFQCFSMTTMFISVDFFPPVWFLPVVTLNAGVTGISWYLPSDHVYLWNYIPGIYC